MSESSLFGGEPEPEVEALVPEADNQSMFRAPQFGLGD